jgi:ATP-dependent Clp protease ATP-binding subunit ClpA
VFERFTKAAREVVLAAAAVAADRGNPRVGPEHLLAGVAETSSPASDLLEGLGAGPERVRGAIADLDREALATVGIDHDSFHLPPTGSEWLRRKRHIPFNRAAKRTLEGALREAITLRHRYIGSEHILAALASAGIQAPAGKILVGLGVDLESLRRELMGQGRAANG